MLKNAMPSAAVIDSQAVKGGHLPAASCGYDAGKKIKGRKHHALTGTNGLLLGVVVTLANVQDRDGAQLLLCLFCHSFLSLLMIFADGGYAGKPEAFVQNMGWLFGHAASFAPGIVKKLEDPERLRGAATPLSSLSAALAGWSSNAVSHATTRRTLVTTKPLFTSPSSVS